MTRKSQFLGPSNKSNNTNTNTLSEKSPQGPVTGPANPYLHKPGSGQLLAPKAKITRDLSKVDTVFMPSLPNTPAPNNKRNTRDLAQAPMPFVPNTPNIQAMPTPMPQPQRITRDLAQYPASAIPNPAMTPPPQAQMPPWAKNKKGKRPSLKTRFLSMSMPARILLVVLVLLPSLLIIIEGIHALMIYSQVRSGVQHLSNIRAIISEKPGQFGPEKIQKAKQEMAAAKGDFQGLRDKLNMDIALGAASFMLPQQVSSLRAFSNMGVEAMDIGDEAFKSLDVIAPALQGEVLAKDDKPLITPKIMDEITRILTYSAPKLKNIEAQAQQIYPDSLPISANQKDTLKTVLQALPMISSEVEQNKDLSKALRWLLGVDEPRKILLQTMDRSEMRPTGGFTGQFAELNINGGRVGEIELEDVTKYEKVCGTRPNCGVIPDAPYDSWWPIANWGLRDSNLSPDFPTAAKLALKAHQTNMEAATEVDGVVVIAPTFIARLLSALGPIKVPKYNETITAENLEERLHYYQLDNRGIQRSIEVNGWADRWKAAEDGEHENPVTQEARKLFTQQVSKLLMEKMRKISAEQLVSLFREVFNDIKTKEIQVYFKNDDVQKLVAKYGSTNEVDRSDKRDGLFVVHTNVNSSKSSQYMSSTVKDVVQLDSKGGATHNIQIKMAYTMAGSVRGYDTYRDYLRIYVPPTAQLIDGNGFEDPDRTYHCSTNSCAADVYGDGALICPANLATPGINTNYKNNPPYHISNIGRPSEFTDELNRKTFAGWVVFPKNCNMTISLSYYVPPMSEGQPYELIVQRQGGTQDELDLTILPANEQCGQGASNPLYFNGVLATTDKVFTIPKVQKNAQKGSCSPPVKA